MGANPDLSQFPLTAGTMNREKLAFLTAVGFSRQYSQDVHTGCDFLAQPRTGKEIAFFPKGARKALPSKYGAYFYLILDVVAPVLGLYGKEIMRVSTDEEVDAHMASTFT